MVYARHTERLNTNKGSAQQNTWQGKNQGVPNGKKFTTKMLNIGTPTITVLMRPGPEVIKLFPCSSKLSMKFFLLINVKMSTIVGLSEPEKC